MDFRKRNINKTQRNGELLAYNVSSFTSKSNGGGSVSSGNYLPATNNGDGTYTVDLSLVNFNGNIVASGEVSAFGIGSGETSGTTGTIVIEDNLISERTDAALSANQGRILKEMIDGKAEITGETVTELSNLSDVTITNISNGQILQYDTSMSKWVNKDFNTEVSALTEHINDKVIHISETDRTNWDNKLNKSVWDDVFEVDSQGNLKVKVNLYGQGEISAYGSGSTSSGDNTEIILDNYYTKDEIDDKLDNIDIGDIDLSNYATKDHTHSNYTLATTFNNHASNTTVHITTAERNTWNNLVNSSHTHSNKSVLDGISSTKVNNWDGVVSDWNDVFSINSDGSLRAKVNLYGDGEISSFGSGTTENEINLENYYTKSEVNDLIDNLECTGGTVDVDLTNYYTKTQVDTKLNSYATTTALNNHITSTTHITSTERTNWNTAYNNNHTHTNKNVIDGISSNNVTNWNKIVSDWDKIFSINSDGSLKVKVNLYGEGEISAYGSGATENEINLENYYTKDQVNDLIDNIDVGDIDLSDYSLTSHTHSNYALSNHSHSNYALSSHTHSNYALSSHTHSNYALSSHTHSISNITNLQSTLDGKSGTGHSHSNYSLTSHTHSNYVTSNGTVANATNADKLDGYHGSSSNSGNTYVLRNSYGDINVGGINASGDTNIVGNLCVTGEITAYADGGNATPFIYNVTSYSSINSTATNQVPTANVAYLIKEELEATKTRLTAAETKLNAIKTQLSNLTTSSSLTTVINALIGIKNNL